MRQSLRKRSGILYRKSTQQLLAAMPEGELHHTDCFPASWSVPIAEGRLLPIRSVTGSQMEVPKSIYLTIAGGMGLLAVVFAQGIRSLRSR